MQRQRALSWGDPARRRLLDHDLPRVDGPDKLTGRAVFTHDVRLPGMLWARVLFSPHPVAEPAVDLEAALAVEGVVLARLCAESWNDGRVGRLGAPVAAVAAETPQAAEDALRALGARFELGRWVLTHEAATAPDAPALSAAGNVRFRMERGDEAAVRAALGECAAVVEATYELPAQFHACLETHGVVVDYRGGDEAVVYASTQGAQTVAVDAAPLLGLPPERVTCIVQHMGGGFGSKFGLDVPGMIACKLAREAGRPVHLMFTRADEFLAGGSRSASRQTLVAGARPDGRLAALHATVWKYGGMGVGAHPGFPYIYSAERVHCATASVLTNLDGSRAMRAPGHPQASFAIESTLDELAHRLALDPLTVRKRNLEDPVYHRQLDRVARAVGWEAHPHKLGPPAELPEEAIGIGFAVTTWNAGGRPQCNVRVRIEPDGGVSARVGSQDLGTGTRTYLAAIVAEELGLPLGAVQARIGDSRLGKANASGGSVTVPALAPAAKDAAVRARASLQRRVAAALDCDPRDLRVADGRITHASDETRARSWSEACALLGAEAIEERGVFRPELATTGVHGAQAAKVRVDTLTGAVRVLHMAAVQDCGLPLNRLAARSQVQGAMLQSLGYALFERRELDVERGLLLNGSLEEYRVPGALDVPELTVLLDDEDERPQVAGIGEPPVIAGQSAIAAAVFNACGVRVRTLPISAAKLVTALAERS